jgi:hypothetical protein
VSATALVITDRVTGAGRHAAIGRFPLHPLVTSVTPEPNGWRLELPGGRMVRASISGAGQHFVADGSYAPAFGQRVARPVLTWQYEGPLPLTVEMRFEL